MDRRSNPSEASDRGWGDHSRGSFAARSSESVQSGTYDRASQADMDCQGSNPSRSRQRHLKTGSLAGIREKVKDLGGRRGMGAKVLVWMGTRGSGGVLVGWGGQTETVEIVDFANSILGGNHQESRSG